MSFYSRAWESAGHEYGRRHAERYAKVARLIAFAHFLLIVCGILFLVAMYNIGSMGEPAPATPPPTMPAPTAR